MAVVTVSRQFGSGGTQIAGRVCELLGYRYLDKVLMTQVAVESGLSGKELVDFTTAEGANWHCEPMAPQLRAQRVFDWLEKVLA